MLTNPRADRVRSVAALSRRSTRQRTGLFVAEGPQSVREAVRFAPDAIRELYITAAVAGAALFTGLQALGLGVWWAGLAGFAAAFALRAGAILFGWRLPGFPGRAPPERP